MQRRRGISGQKRHSQIHSEGSSAANRLLVIRYLANGLDHSRFAFVVSKRVGNAVVRNKIRRRLREVVRESAFSEGWDAVFIARRGIERASFQELERAAYNLLRRSRILQKKTERVEDRGQQTPSCRQGRESTER